MTEGVEKASWRGWIQLLLGLGLTYLFFYMMAPFIVPFVVGAVCAILCYPLFTFTSKKIPRPLAAFTTSIALTAGVLVPIVYLLYSGAHRLILFLKRFKIMQTGQTVESLADHPLVKRVSTFISAWMPIDKDWIHTQALSLLQTVIELLSSSVGAFLASAPGLIMAIVIVVLSCYFFLLDGAKFLRFLVSLSPMRTNRSFDLYQTFERSCRGVVLGLFISGVVQGLLMAILFTVTGLPDPIFIFLITIVAGMIPLIGSAPIWIGAVLYHISNGATPYAVVMLLGGLVVSTSDNIVRPIVMKEHAEMHPLLALVSVFGAINLFGPTGIFLGPVIAALFVSFLKIVSMELKREAVTDV